MAVSTSLVAYRALFITLGCFMLATLLYTLIADGSPFRKELLTPTAGEKIIIPMWAYDLQWLLIYPNGWMNATLIDFYVNVLAIAVWVAYKESYWINATLWIILLVCFGSITTCAYIVKNLFNIPSRGNVQDPVRLVLFRNECQLKIKCCSLWIWRVVFSALALFMAVVVIYTVFTDGLPFRRELLTPWMAATLIDFYINIFVISVWVAHKESSWISAFIWICLLICFGSITTCTYIAIQLFQLSDRDPICTILLDSHSKHSTNTPLK